MYAITILGVEADVTDPTSVETLFQTLEAGPGHPDILVNCAGLWAKRVGELAGVPLAAGVVEHQYFLTEKKLTLVFEYLDLDLKHYMDECGGRVRLRAPVFGSAAATAAIAATAAAARALTAVFARADSANAGARARRLVLRHRRG